MAKMTFSQVMVSDCPGAVSRMMPVTCPVRAVISVTRAWVSIVTPCVRHQPTCASAISHAFPLEGKTLRPRSTVNGTPIRSKKRIVASLSNLWRADAKKSAPHRTLVRNSSSLHKFVRLQRPFPVMRTLRWGFSIRSHSSTFPPREAATPAAMMPAAPPPMTTVAKCLIPEIFRQR